MIFVTLGSQKFQFNRILKEIDRLIEIGIIKEEVFAQIGYSDYKPKYFEFKKFLDRDEFIQTMDRCEKIITHGGTGTIISAIKKDKKVIAVARLAKYDEHVDDHQLQLIKEFNDINLIFGTGNCNELEAFIKKIDNKVFNKYLSNTDNIIKSLESYIDSI